MDSLPELAWFLVCMLTALLMGVAVGVERQFGQHPAGLRTNALVCLGAALFVGLAHLVHDKEGPARLAGYIISGVGFLGGGVILREGLTVKGINTAATLWCTAAVGVLAGAGFPHYSVAATAILLGSQLALRPAARWIDERTRTMTNVEMAYRMRVVCKNEEQTHIRAVLLRHGNSHPDLTVRGLSVKEVDAQLTAVVADLHSSRRNDKELEEIVNRLNIEPAVTSVSWEHVT